MTTKYHKYTLKGELSADEAKKSIGDAASQGIVVRIENSGGKTYLFTASQGEKESGGKKAAAAGAGKIKVEEVSEADVTKIG